MDGDDVKKALTITDQIISTATDYIPTVLTLIVSIVIIYLSNSILNKKASLFGREGLFYRRLIILIMIVIAIITVILSLPINEGFRGQIIALISLVISGIFAFSSGNIFSNLMAGIVLRFTEPFKIGDFIYIGEFFGRVTERGLFDTEVQAENRKLMSIPNSYILSQPVKTVRSSGAIISVEVSLGYDVHHSRIEELLIKAAKRNKLKDPFVHILELGDFTVNYRISGLLEDITGMITARSNLFREVLDVLHDANIEIMSPTVMNQRRIDENALVIPKKPVRKKTTPKAVAEDIVFDKAEKVVQTGQEKEALLKDIKTLEDSISESVDTDKEDLQAQYDEKIEQLRQVQAVLDGHKNDEEESVESNNQ